MPRPKAGLRINYHDHVENLTTGLGEVVSAVPAGWFIEVLRSSRWYAIMDLRFAREKDAVRALRSLTAAGFDTHIKLRAADALTIKQVACEHLQW